MSAELFLCMTQEEITVPYTFKMTGINVYSMEEAAYHCFTHWKQTNDEYCGREFLAWVNNVLNLPHFASKIKLIGDIKSSKDKMIAFLSLLDYFDELQIFTLKTQLTQWESMLKWQQLKEQGDYLHKKGDMLKAINFYMKALQIKDDISVLNNLALSYMAICEFERAKETLVYAVEIEPNNMKILLNLAESYIYSKNFEQALRTLSTCAQIDKDNSAIEYLYGELNFETGNVRYSIDHFERAIDMKPENHYIYRLTDVYVKLRQYDKAEQNLKRIAEKDRQYFDKLSTFYYEYGNIPAAIKTVESALLQNPNDANLWAKLATYLRLDYNETKAQAAILKALSIDPQSNPSKFELAKIKKTMGKTKEYREILGEILDDFKGKYRETHQI